METKGLKESKYQLLADGLRKDIVSGKLKANEKLPSKRNLASEQGISVITVMNAYSQLLAEGYIYSKEKSGYYVADIESYGTPVGEEYISYPSSFENETKKKNTNPTLFPFSQWAKIMRKVLTERYDTLLEPGPNTGVFELRKAISEYMLKKRGLQTDPGNIVIGAGTEYLYNLIIQLFGGKISVAIENPGHSKISKIYSANGISPLYLNISNNGILMNELEGMDVNLLHISPSHHYPTGYSTPAWKRIEILRWANENDAYIIEDDYDSDFRLVGQPIKPLKELDHNNRVIYINTFSRSISPSLRISYMILPKKLALLFEKKLGFYSCTVPVFEQYTLAEFISQGYFERHMNRIKTFCRKQKETVPQLLQEFGITDRCEVIGKDSGLHFILKIKTEKTDKELKKILKGLNYRFVSDYLINPDKNYENMLIVDYLNMSPEIFRKIAEIT